MAPTHVYDEPGEYAITLTVANSSNSDTDTFTIVVNAPRLYAPELRLHQHEEWWPDDPARFVAASGLWWAHDAGCDDVEVVPAGSLSVRALVSGDYEHQNASNVLCRDKGDYYTSRQLTAPARGGKLGLGGDSKKINGGKREGFFLDIPNGERDGIVAADMSYSNAPPLYYDYEPGRYVIYWFFYSFSSRKGDKHEGDWERLAVRLDDNDEARRAAYWQHFCDPLDSDTTYGTYSWDEMVEAGYLVQDTADYTIDLGKKNLAALEKRPGRRTPPLVRPQSRPGHR